MKKRFTLLLSIIWCTFGLAQEGTTLEEYRYFSKGYIYQLEMGLDAQKDGYQVKNLFTASNNGDLVGLYKNGQQEPRALLVILQPGTKNTAYVCVPNGNAESRVKELATAEQAKLSMAQRQQYQAALNEFLFAALSSPDNQELALRPQTQIPINYGSSESLANQSSTKPEAQVTVKSPQKVIVPTTADFQYNPQTQATVNTPVPGNKPAVEAKNMSSAVILGELSTRGVIKKQDAAVNTNSRGVVSIKVCVDNQGNIKTAKFTQRGSTTFNSSLKAAALKAAKETQFTKLDIAEQCGIIQYSFN